MKIIVLPGFSVANKEWADEVKSRLGGEEIEVVEWEHWLSGDKRDFSVEKELERILRVVGDEEVMVVSKSVGTYMAMLLLTKVKRQVRRLILCGIALNDFSDADKEKFVSLKLFDGSQILVIQNKEDPHGGYDEVKEFVLKINSDVKIVEKIGNDHEYPYFEDFVKFLSYE